MEIVLAALAEAIFALIIEDLAQRPRLSQLRDKLRGDSPEKVALQHALAKTYRTFAETYPQIAHAFLDEHFLSKTEVAAELATLLTPDRVPNAQAIILLWRTQFHPAPTVDIDTEVDFFLTTLDREIKSQPALKPFSDSRAFEQLYTIAERSASQVAEQQTTNEHLRQIHAELVAMVAILHEKVPGLQINTEGGSYIAGNVDTQGGPFISRDKITNSEQPTSDSHERHAGHTLVNPFTDRGRINDPNRFFVRQPIVRELQQALAAGNSIALIGDSGVGKSSLLKYLQMTHSTWLPHHQVLYLNLQGVLNESDFCTEVLQELTPLHMGRLRTVTDALVALKRAVRGRKLLLMFDEVERLAEGDLTPRLQGLLRALLEEGNLLLLVASKLPIHKVFPPSDPTSPLHNVFSAKVLPYFAQEEMHRFLQQRLAATSIRFSDDEVSSIWQASSGHPAKIQRAAEAHFSRKTEQE